MPTYEYICQNCEHEFEQFQSITAKTLRKCPECSKMKLRRLIGSGSGVIFKGSGFYQTDYRSESYKNGAKNDKEKSGTTSKSKDKETKPKKKSESKAKNTKKST